MELYIIKTEPIHIKNGLAFCFLQLIHPRSGRQFQFLGIFKKELLPRRNHIAVINYLWACRCRATRGYACRPCAYTDNSACCGVNAIVYKNGFDQNTILIYVFEYGIIAPLLPKPVYNACTNGHIWVMYDSFPYCCCRI